MIISVENSKKKKQAVQVTKNISVSTNLLFQLSYSALTISINIHPLTVVLLWRDRTPEQGSWPTAPQQALPCCLWRPHKDPEGTSVTFIWNGASLYITCSHCFTRHWWLISHNSLSWPKPPKLLSTNPCSLKQNYPNPTETTYSSTCYLDLRYRSYHQSSHTIKARKKFYSQWGGCWYFGASVTALCLIRSGRFRLGCYLKTERWATFHPTPSAMAYAWKRDTGKQRQRRKIGE